MEKVLKGNNRKSNLYRLFALSFFFISLMMTFLFYEFNTHTSIEEDEMVTLKEAYQNEIQERNSEREKLQKKIQELKDKTKACEESVDADEKLKILEEEIKEKKEEIDDLNTELSRCESKLASLRE